MVAVIQGGVLGESRGRPLLPPDASNCTKGRAAGCADLAQEGFGTQMQSAG